MKIGLISLVEPSLSSAKQQLIGEENQLVISSFFKTDPGFVLAVVPVETEAVRASIVRFCDTEKCNLVLTLGGSGPRVEDVVPDVTRSVIDRELPGFGEIIRQYSFERFRVSLLSRATAGVRGQSLIINLPSRPKPLKFCFKLIREGMAEAVKQVSGEIVELSDDFTRVPMEKYFPFLKHLRIKPDPRDK